MGYSKYSGGILRASKRKKGNDRYSAKLIVRKINEAKGMVRKARYREYNARSEAIGGLIKYITNKRKDM